MSNDAELGKKWKVKKEKKPKQINVVYKGKTMSLQDWMEQTFGPAK